MGGMTSWWQMRTLICHSPCSQEGFGSGLILWFPTYLFAANHFSKGTSLEGPSIDRTEGRRNSSLWPWRPLLTWPLPTGPASCLPCSTPYPPPTAPTLGRQSWFSLSSSVHSPFWASASPPSVYKWGLSSPSTYLLCPLGQVTYPLGAWVRSKYKFP